MTLQIGRTRTMLHDPKRSDPLGSNLLRWLRHRRAARGPEHEGAG
jgi:hypothetical protein